MKRQRSGFDAGLWQPSSAMRVMVERVMVAFAVTPEEFFGTRRFDRIVRARMAAVWLVRQHWELPWVCVARVIGRDSRDTVKYLGAQAVMWRDRDEAFRTLTDALLSGAPIPAPRPVMLPPVAGRGRILPQQVKPKNRVPEDDTDARMRRGGTNALVLAIAASGGGFR